MPEIEVTAEDVARLGESLGEISAFLAALDRVGTIDPWAFGPGAASDAVRDVLGNWERYRLLLGRHPTPWLLPRRTRAAAMPAWRPMLRRPWAGREA